MSRSAAMPVTEQRLEQALRDLARIVAIHGQQYMPLFERTANELQLMRGRRQQMLQIMTSLEPPTIETTYAEAG